MQNKKTNTFYVLVALIVICSFNIYGQNKDEDHYLIPAQPESIHITLEHGLIAVFDTAHCIMVKTPSLIVTYREGKTNPYLLEVMQAYLWNEATHIKNVYASENGLSDTLGYYDLLAMKTKQFNLLAYLQNEGVLTQGENKIKTLSADELYALTGMTHLEYLLENKDRDTLNEKNFTIQRL